MRLSAKQFCVLIMATVGGTASAAAASKSGAPVDDAPVERIMVLHGDDLGVSRFTLDLEGAAAAYHRDFGRFPVGDNRAITRQLFGLNSRKNRYMSLWFDSLFDERGNLVDPWLEPYHFAVRGHQMWVFSRQYDAARQRARPTDWFARYAPRPHVSKRWNARSDCYKVALAVRLAAQDCQKFPPRPQWSWLLVSSSSDGYLRTWQGNNPLSTHGARRS